MTKATPAVTTKKDNRLRCGRCDKKFTPKRSNQKYCSSDCRVNGNSSKRTSAKKQYEIPRSAPFCLWLLQECRRAGHVQILSGHTEQSLMELYKLHAYTSKVNMHKAVTDDTGYHKSHIIPVQGPRLMGLLHAENLVIATAMDNKQHGIKHFGYGRGIERHMLNDRWSVPKTGMTNETLFGLILEVVGKEKYERFAKAAKLKPSPRMAHIKYLESVLHDDNPDHKEHLKALRSKGTTTRALGTIVATLKGKKVNAFKMECDYFSPFRVYKEEALRLSRYRPELAVLHEMLKEIELIQYSRTLEEPRLEPWETAALFDILHGRELSDFDGLLSDMRERHVQWSKELIQKYDPHAFDFSLFDGVMDLDETTEPKAIKVYGSFVDELDEVTDTPVPVMPLALMHAHQDYSYVEAPF